MNAEDLAEFGEFLDLAAAIDVSANTPAAPAEVPSITDGAMDTEATHSPEAAASVALADELHPDDDNAMDTEAGPEYTAPAGPIELPAIALTPQKGWHEKWAALPGLQGESGAQAAAVVIQFKAKGAQDLVVAVSSQEKVRCLPTENCLLQPSRLL